jgi:hypothetical protein
MPITQEISMDEANKLQNDLNNASQLYVPKAWFIDKAVLIDALGLNSTDLANFSGIRIYPGAKYEEAVDSPPTGNKTVTLITVAVDTVGNDIVGSVASDVILGSKIYDYAAPCPMICPTNNTPLFKNAYIYSINK